MPQFPLSVTPAYLKLPPPGADAEDSAVPTPAQTGDGAGWTV